MSARRWCVVFVERSTSGSDVCGVERPELRWSKSTIR